MPPTPTPPILISGASFAGPATALWMTRLGHQVTVVERAETLRTGGPPADIEGKAIPILARMGPPMPPLCGNLPQPRRLPAHSPTTEGNIK